MGAIEAASEIGILQNFFFLLFLTPQIGESVDDDTKNEIENDNDDHEEEEHVVNHSSSKHRLLQIPSTNEETVKRGYTKQRLLPNLKRFSYTFLSGAAKEVNNFIWKSKF